MISSHKKLVIENNTSVVYEIYYNIKMDSFLRPAFAIYYRFCNPLSQLEYDKKKQDGDFKRKIIKKS